MLEGIMIGTAWAIIVVSIGIFLRNWLARRRHIPAGQSKRDDERRRVLGNSHKQTGFVNLDKYHEEREEPQQSDPDWEPEMNTAWAREGGAQVDMLTYEVETLHFGINRVRQIAFDRGPLVAATSFELRTAELVSDELGRRWVYRNYTQGYDRGGFSLEPQLISSHS